MKFWKIGTKWIQNSKRLKRMKILLSPLGVEMQRQKCVCYVKLMPLTWLWNTENAIPFHSICILKILSNHMLQNGLLFHLSSSHFSESIFCILLASIFRLMWHMHILLSMWNIHTDYIGFLRRWRWTGNNVRTKKSIDEMRVKSSAIAILYARSIIHYSVWDFSRVCWK